MTLLLKTVPPARGPRWMRDALRLYSRRPFAFTMMFTVFMFAAVLTTVVPVVGGVLQMMLLPLLTLGFMIASQSALLDGPVHPRQFIEPLRGDPARRRSLLLLCASFGVTAALILLLADAVSGNAMGRLMDVMAKGDAGRDELDALLAEPGVGAAALTLVVLGSLLAVPYWHAPALVHWGGQRVAQALFSSTLAVWRAKGAFLTYMLSWALLVMAFGVVSALVFSLLGARQLVGIAAVPAGLMFSTVFYVSLLFTFNDSFGGASAVIDGADADPPPLPRR